VKQRISEGKQRTCGRKQQTSGVKQQANKGGNRSTENRKPSSDKYRTLKERSHKGTIQELGFTIFSAILGLTAKKYYHPKKRKD
jgi:hypothetical protein